MIILSIETSCDETAVTVLEARGSIEKPSFKVLGNALASQTHLHKKYGGVYPTLARREHTKNLPILLSEVLRKSGFEKKARSKTAHNSKQKIERILAREPELIDFIISLGSRIEKPEIDLIAVTYGPGLEPALWVGINFARSLGALWDIPVLPVNHMEGHIMSVMLTDIAEKRGSDADNGRKNSNLQSSKKPSVGYPALALLISGGHTELVYSKKPLEYKKIGETRDDAVGEAYDKVARMLGLPYPGGPEISKLADETRKKSGPLPFSFPRPMIHSDNYDFSFSGLKTSVLYFLNGKKLTNSLKQNVALAFEEAVFDVLISKTERALNTFKPKSLIVAGGVIANVGLRKAFQKMLSLRPHVTFFVPERELSTDNSIMIGVAAYAHTFKKKGVLRTRRGIRATGNASLATRSS